MDLNSLPRLMKSMKKLSIVLASAILAGVLFLSGLPVHAGQESSASAPKLSKQQAQAQADIKLGDVARDDHAIGEAIADYRAAVVADPSNPDAHDKFIQLTIYSVELSRVKEKEAKPVKNDKKLTKEQEQAQEAKVEAEQKRLKAKRGKEHAKLEASLLATYDRWIKKNPREAMFYWGKGEVYAYHSENEPAVAWYHKAIAIDDSCAPAWASLSDWAAQNGNVAEQRQDAEKALAIDPSDKAGAFFEYALTYLTTDPPKYRQLVQERVDRYPEDLGMDFLLEVGAENAPSPQEEQATYEKLYQLYGPRSAHPSNNLDYIMPALFNLYANEDSSKALSFAEKVQRDEAAAQGKETDSKTQRPLWQTIANYQRSIVEAQSLISKKQYSDALSLLGKNALKDSNYFDPLSRIDQTPYQLAKAKALAGSGQTQQAYDSVKTALMPQPDAALEAGLISYGAKLGKTPAQVREDVWQTREAKAKLFAPFDLKQYVTNKDLKLAGFRGHVVLINFWGPS